MSLLETTAAPPPLALRPFQAEALRALARPRAHVLCVAPTGSGKSLIYEREAARPGTRTALITPLLALARQQVASLRGAGLAAALGAGPEAEEPPEGDGIWILSPEKLGSARTRRSLERWRPNFLVVDECHCIWEWGERFRPAFREIPALLQRGGAIRSLWLTATLPLAARAELRACLPEGLVELGDFDLPPGLELAFQEVGWVERDDALLRLARGLRGTGLVFVFSRRQAEGVARLLSTAGIPAVAYHAGLSLEEKRAIERSIALDGATGPRAIVGTSALGMGLDLPRLSWVILRQAPLSALSLAQSVGRVARGQAGSARAIVLWSEADFQLMEGITAQDARARGNLRELHALLRSRDCRRQALSRCFRPESAVAACGNCDQCRRARLFAT